MGHDVWVRTRAWSDLLPGKQNTRTLLPLHSLHDSLMSLLQLEWNWAGKRKGEALAQA